MHMFDLDLIWFQLDQFQGRQMEELAERRRAAMQYYRDEYERNHPGYQNVSLSIRLAMVSE